MDKEEKGIFKYYKLKRKYNTLLNKYETLLDATKEKCFETIFNRINEDQSVIRIKKTNKNLRLKIKALQEIIKEGDYGRNNIKKTRRKSSTRNKSNSRTKSK